MGADEPLMKNKSQLDSLAKQASPPVKDSAVMLSKPVRDRGKRDGKLDA